MLPYKNANSSKPLPGQDQVPAVVQRGQDGAQVWVALETGANKSPIADATLLYTVNGGGFDYSRGRREMWFQLPAKVNGNRIEASVPPGTSHAVFCIVDTQGFLVDSAMKTPDGSDARSDTAAQKDTFDYRPGLFALIQLGHDGMDELKHKGLSDAKLNQSLNQAVKLYDAEDVTENEYHQAIRGLRHSILNLKGTITQADNEYLTLFRQGDAF